MRESETLVTYTSELRSRWPDPLAKEWREAYPDLFDEDDFRLANTQPQNHFREWLAAIHLHERHGAISLVEKYLYTSKGLHARKATLLREHLNEDQLSILKEIAAHRPGGRQGPGKNVQPPDLFVFTQEGKFWFAEVKGPHERLSSQQLESHAKITQLLGVPVQIIRVCPTTRIAA